MSLTLHAYYELHLYLLHFGPVLVVRPTMQADSPSQIVVQKYCISWRVRAYSVVTQCYTVNKSLQWQHQTGHLRQVKCPT